MTLPRCLVDECKVPVGADLLRRGTATRDLVTVAGGLPASALSALGHTAFQQPLLISSATGAASAARIPQHRLLDVRNVSRLVGQSFVPSAITPFDFISSPRVEDFSASAEVSDPVSWLPSVLRRMEALLSLPDDWDRYGASRVQPVNAQRAFVLLSRIMLPATPPPALVPTGNGGIQLEWHRAGLDVEILVSGGEEDGLYVRDLATGEEWEGDPEEGFRLFQLARRLEGAATPVAA